MTGLAASHCCLLWWVNLGGTHDEFITEVWFAILMVDICAPSPLIHLTLLGKVGFNPSMGKVNNFCVLM